MKRKSILITIFIFTVSLFFTYSVFAYFEQINNLQSENYVITGNQTLIEIEKEKDLILFSKYYKDNSTQNVSDAEKRLVLKLTQNIEISQNIVFTADLNLNLNGYTLNLLDNNILIRHNFYGSTLIYGGTVSGTGKIIFDTPNTVSVFDGTLQGAIIDYYSYSEVLLKDKIFTYISDKILSGEGGRFYVTDVILPLNYYNFDVDISYQSSDSLKISNGGKLLDRSVTSDIIITLNLVINQTTYINHYSVKIIGQNDSTALFYAGKEIFLDYISGYKNIATQTYIINKDLMLINAIDYLGLDFIYKSYDNYIDKNIILADIVNGVLKILSNSRTVFLEVEITDGVSSLFFENPVNIVLTDRYSIVNSIIQEIGILVIIDIDTVIDLADEQDYYAVGITSINYSFTGNNGNYIIQNNQLKVTAMPTDITPVYLNIDFTFTGDFVITRRLAINLQSSDGGGSGNDEFNIYYLYLNNLLSERTNNNVTYITFSLPAYLITWDNKTINFAYRVTLTPSSSILSLSNNAEDWFFTINQSIIPVYDTQVKLEYVDPFTETLTYYSLFSTFTIPGITRQGTGANDIKDINLYNRIKAVYGTEQDTYLLTNQLQKAVDNFAVNIAITDFKGIEYLEYTQGFDFRGSGFRNTDFLYLRGLNNLKRLNVSENILTSISNLSDLNGLVYINVSKNNLDWFDPLLRLPSLAEADIFLNTGSTSNYGSTGNYNSNVFILLKNRGLNLYNTYDSVNLVRVLYVYNEHMLSASRILEAIIYQNVATSIGVISRPTTVGGYTISYTNLTTTRYMAYVTVNSNTVYKIFDITIG